MSETDEVRGLPTLYSEHLLLNAQYSEDGTLVCYGNESMTERAPEDGEAFLCDVSNTQTLVFDGDVAPSFAQAAFAGKELSVGECAPEAVLTGDGSVASLPLLARTGEREYVCLDGSPRAEVLGAWLSFLSAVSKDGYAPYASMKTDDATQSHVKLALWGPGARAILHDYAQTLPKHGRVAAVNLDRIPCIVASLPTKGTDYFLVLVPPHAAVALWRSLLSFTEVTPVGHDALVSEAATLMPWTSRLKATDSLRLASSELKDWGLVRAESDFVGARGLNR